MAVNHDVYQLGASVERRRFNQWGLLRRSGLHANPSRAAPFPANGIDAVYRKSLDTRYQTQGRTHRWPGGALPHAGLAESCHETALLDEQLIQGFLSHQKPEHGRTWWNG
jgi:hypothetical protein